ncbi:PREDICTED: uncharacterized protein LOC104816629 isoform X2 [Tarenaya hassleriana]|uniref:uncharacterized protein LOC104816629 isoform X2 n=1 Tax=Tarenaya hassleriana TaxID=28532 RepID=UPI00053C4658|nr:PREDICTED: uncharacterized protein LOC104816629 isoform X2 [Tarenaya hassleriana]
MQKKRQISEYRARLDKTLSSPDLTNVETLKTLIKKQLCSPSHHESRDILDKRTENVSIILDKLRSASSSSNDEASYGDWKLKSDYEDCRVMYREGLEGSPFHTLLVEGYVDGPVEECLCVSWESILYKKWWPQTSFPSFKVLQNRCLQKVWIGEQICLVRMKVPWPMSDREAVVHYFLFEYFKDGLIVVLVNTISDLESIGFSSNDFDKKNGIPEALNAVRIDMVGGFALQKVTPERSYFRTIADMDVKFDLVPPSLINFISRQLVGNGFRLYKKVHSVFLLHSWLQTTEFACKNRLELCCPFFFLEQAVASVAKVDEDYSKALADPMYTQIHRALYSSNKPDDARGEIELNTRECVGPRNEIVQKMEGKDKDPKPGGHEQDARYLPNNESDEEHLPLSDVSAIENEPLPCRKTFSEIEEEDCEENVYSRDGSEDNDVSAKCRVNSKRRFCVSPEVEQALGTLERVISMVRRYQTDTRGQSTSSSSFSDGELPENIAEDPPDKVLSLSENNGVVPNNKAQVLDRISHESIDGSSIHIIRSTRSSSLGRENLHNRIAPASPEQDLPTPTVTAGIRGTPEIASYFRQMSETEIQTRTEPGERHDIGVLNRGKNPKLTRKRRVCCFAFKSWH